MVLMKETPVPAECDAYMYSGQKALQRLLLIVALLCVPVMLLGKPIYIMRQHKKTPHVPVNTFFFLF